MLIRKWCSIAGFLTGIAYTAFGMTGAYKMPAAVSTSTLEIVMQFCIFSVFTGAFLGCIGLGIGLLLEGLVKSASSASAKAQEK